MWKKKKDTLLLGFTNACKSRYDKAYASYKDCRKDLYWEDHYGCITMPGSNYEEIDCSEKAMMENVNDFSSGCYTELNKEYNSLIAYEEEVAQDFLESLPKSQSFITSSELQNLYNQFPQEAFNEKTKERLNKYIEGRGYTVEK